VWASKGNYELTNQELIDIVAGNLHIYDMRDEMLMHNHNRYAPLRNGEEYEYNQSILRSHALLIQYYLDRSYPKDHKGWEYEIEVRVKRRPIQQEK
jgi:hypothetical protein